MRRRSTPKAADAQPPPAASADEPESVVPAASGAAPPSAAARHVICPPKPVQSGYAVGHSALAVQIWRLPLAPQADWAWQVPPLAWQQTSPPAHALEDAQIVTVPDAQAVPVLQVAVPPPPSVGVKQHELPLAQSVGAEHTCAVPDGHVVWHVLGPHAEPRQHCWPVMQSAVPAHEGGVLHVP